MRGEAAGAVLASGHVRRRLEQPQQQRRGRVKLGGEMERRHFTLAASDTDRDVTLLVEGRRVRAEEQLARG